MSGGFVYLVPEYISSTEYPIKYILRSHASVFIRGEADHHKEEILRLRIYRHRIQSKLFWLCSYEVLCPVYFVLDYSVLGKVKVQSTLYRIRCTEYRILHV